METVKAVIDQIIAARTQQSASKKDEVTVMQAMMNDRGYEVGIYDRSGQVGTYNPASDLRTALANQFHKAVKIPQQEAVQLADAYEFTRSDATTQVNVSKEFVNTYLGTGRKLPLGVRETSDVSLLQKEVKECDRTYPKKTGVNADGSDRYEKAVTHVPAHTSVRVISSCPEHVKG